MARDIGSAAWLLIIWLVTGLITVAAALSGELAGMMQRQAVNLFTFSVYGRLVSFLWLDCFTVIQTGVIAAIAVTFANYSAIFFPVLDTTLLDWAIVLFFLLVNCWLSQVLLYSFINTKGIESGKLIQLILTSAKLIALLH
jgi:APA family basic amino acid/polyamine antiporter